METAEGWQVSTPSPILYAAHKAALEIFEAAGIEGLVQKSNRLTGYLHYLLDEINRQQQEPVFHVITPAQRGCQLSILVPRIGKQLFDYLGAHGVFADWREPDVIRVAPVPLYNTFEEVYTFGLILQQGMGELKQ